MDGASALDRHRSRDRACAPQAAAAMHNHAAAALQCAMYLRRKRSLTAHGIICWDVQILDRKVEPGNAK